ncbi:hypothetical protein HDV00_003367 [Rhizophlyctis rosea]|nr:hypothetical protein HDV00_003367 [Rhizophlyctis rosea]
MELYGVQNGAGLKTVEELVKRLVRYGGREWLGPVLEESINHHRNGLVTMLVQLGVPLPIGDSLGSLEKMGKIYDPIRQALAARNGIHFVSSARVVALITGATPGGIGFALCKEWARRGFKVYGAVRRPAVAEEISNGGYGFEAIVLDVTDQDSIKNGVERIIRERGRIDVLINNAGVSYPNPITETDLQGIKSLFEANVFGLIAMTQEVFPHMASSRSGLIINIGSITAYVPTPWGGAYAASKASVKSLSSIMRMEMKPFGIKVLHVALGGVTTNLPQVRSALSST